uniref:DNA topoisomerase I n=1 Tax=Pneumocystis carinii TaxID=4754 RepID=O60013_PNECA|nr:DNA topoisomerase I [Pneumocystis carinii]
MNKKENIKTIECDSEYFNTGNENLYREKPTFTLDQNMINNYEKNKSMTKEMVNSIREKKSKKILKSKQSNNLKNETSENIEIKKEIDEKSIKTEKKLKKKHKSQEKELNSEELKNEESLRSKEEEEDYKWWEQQQGDGTIKWKTLEHNGVLFPPPYEPLPSYVKMKYKGEPISLPPEAEEVAGFFGAILSSEQYVKNPTFQKNFFHDFQETCKKTNAPVIPEKFEYCDFTPMFEYFEKKKEEKKNKSKEEKKKIKEEKDALEEKYKYCFLDGRKEKVGNFRIEPPGLFRGRGDHPKTGKLKTRVVPEQVIINIGKDSVIPSPPPGHNWKEVRHDNTVTWLATWNENVNNNVKYVFLSAGSSLKGQSDLKKYEKARELKLYIDNIRKQYRKELEDKLMEVRQRATAMYLIDLFALRAGNEKGEDEADTVGCCSLRYEHISLSPPNTVVFDFLGKDSIRYYNEVQVDPQVFKNLKIFKRSPKTEGDMLFDRLNTSKLNNHLTSLMPGLSAKVFRTHNASYTMSEQLKNTPKDASISDKVLAYNRANRMVAILCNHQRTISKTHSAQMERIEDKILALKYQKIRLRKAILTLDPKLEKSRPDLSEAVSDIDEDWIKEHQKVLIEKEYDKIKRKFQKDNEKLISQNETPMPESRLEKFLEKINEMKEEFKIENEKGRVESKTRGITIETLDLQIKKINERIHQMKALMIDKAQNKTTALGTSKINYIDPRLTYAWCAKYGVNIERVFTKTLRETFAWAASTTADWEF